MASMLLPTNVYQRYERAMHSLLPVLLMLFRISLVACGGLLVVPSAILRPWIPLIFVVSTLPPLMFTSFFSLEVLALLPRYYEFWFISMLNVLTWVGLGVIFGDLRALMCLTLWLNFHSVIVIDGNFRTFPAAVKSTVISGPAMVMLVVCSAYNIVADSSSGAASSQAHQVVFFTASTIAIFMFKKAYTKRRRMRDRLRDRKNTPTATPGRHTIPCVLISARLRLGPRNSSESLTSARVSSTAANSSFSQGQQLHLAPGKGLVLDAQETLLPGHLLYRLSSRYALIALIVVGVVGLSTTSISWIIMLGHYQREWNDLELGISLTAAICSGVFFTVCIGLTQRDLLRLLVWNFDVLFSTIQATALALCLLDLLRWQIPSCFAVVAWWFWLHCLLVLDAITPTFTCQFNIRKHFGLPVVVVVLTVVVGCAVELVIGHDDVFVPRLLWCIRVVDRTRFDVHTSTLAVQRIVTIVSWFIRLLVELATASPDQLLFIRRPVEYFSPYATFSEPAPTLAKVRERRRARF